MRQQLVHEAAIRGRYEPEHFCLYYEISRYGFGVEVWTRETTQALQVPFYGTKFVTKFVLLLYFSLSVA
jgi:hypothetical protein